MIDTALQGVDNYNDTEAMLPFNSDLPNHKKLMNTAHNLYYEKAYLLARMGRLSEAICILINNVGDVEVAVRFVNQYVYDEMEKEKQFRLILAMARTNLQLFLIFLDLNSEVSKFLYC